MGIDVTDVQDKSKVFAEILNGGYSRQIRSDKLTINDFNYKKPPNGWVISVDQTRKVDVELVLQKNKDNTPIEKHYDVWLKTKSPKGVVAKADVGTLKPPPRA